MIALMNRMTDKAGWERKILDENIVSRWRSEALAAPDKDISEKMFNWVCHLHASFSFHPALHVPPLLGLYPVFEAIDRIDLC